MSTPAVQRWPGRLTSINHDRRTAHVVARRTCKEDYRACQILRLAPTLGRSADHNIVVEVLVPDPDDRPISYVSALSSKGEDNGLDVRASR